MKIPFVLRKTHDRELGHARRRAAVEAENRADMHRHELADVTARIEEEAKRLVKISIEPSRETRKYHICLALDADMFEGPMGARDHDMLADYVGGMVAHYIRTRQFVTHGRD